MSKHTPTPWKMTEARLDAQSEPWGWTIEDGMGRQIAEVHMLTEGRKDEESEANARAMVAAPDLLRELEWAADFVCDRTCGSHQHSEECDRVRTTIKKAGAQ